MAEPTYEREVARQIAEGSGSAKIKNVDDLLNSGETWEVSNSVVYSVRSGKKGSGRLVTNRPAGRSYSCPPLLPVGSFHGGEDGTAAQTCVDARRSPHLCLEAMEDCHIRSASPEMAGAEMAEGFPCVYRHVDAGCCQARCAC